MTVTADVQVCPSSKYRAITGVCVRVGVVGGWENHDVICMFAYTCDILRMVVDGIGWLAYVHFGR